VILAVAHFIRADVHLEDPGLTFADLAVGITQAGPPVSQGLDLGAHQHQAGFPRLENLVLVTSFSIFGDDFDPGGFTLSSHVCSMMTAHHTKVRPILN